MTKLALWRPSVFSEPHVSIHACYSMVQYNTMLTECTEGESVVYKRLETTSHMSQWTILTLSTFIDVKIGNQCANYQWSNTKTVLIKHDESSLSTSNGVFSNKNNDVIMSVMASEIAGPTIVYSTVYSGTDDRKHQSSASLAFVRWIHRWPVNSPHKRPVTRKKFPLNDVIMQNHSAHMCYSHTACYGRRYVRIKHQQRDTVAWVLLININDTLNGNQWHDTPSIVLELHRYMMTSSNGNIFRVTGHLCGEFDVFFDLRPNQRLSKQSWGWWFETPSRSLWRHCNEIYGETLL